MEIAAFRPMSKREVEELLFAWRMSKVALSGQDSSRHARMRWTANQWEKTHPRERMRAYKQLDRELG